MRSLGVVTRVHAWNSTVVMFWPRRGSIRQQLVLVLVVTVVAVTAVHDIVAYRELRRSAEDAATERLRAVSNQVGDLLDAQARGVRAGLTTAVRAPPLAELLRAESGSGAAGAREAARAALLAAATPAQTVAAVELWDAAGKTILTTSAPPAIPDEARRSIVDLVDPSSRTGIGPMMVVGDSLLCAAVGAITDGTGADARTLGYLVQWRRLVGSEEGRTQLADLIGPGADIAMGSTQGDGWTNFATVIPRPNVALPLTAPTWRTVDGTRRLTAARPINGAPWTLVIDFPEVAVQARVGTVVRRLALISAVFLALGIVAAWWLGRRLTTTLAELAGAAGAISAGDYSRRVKIEGGQEVQALGSAFNTMSESIETARRGLEERSEELAERAGQLSEQASELEMTNEELAQSRDDAIRARDELAASFAENERVTAELDTSLASAPVGIAFHDLQGRYRRVNHCFATMNGVGMDAHTGRFPAELVPTFGRSIESYVRQVLDTGKVVNDVELSGATAARPGEIQHWLANFYAIRTASGEMLGAGTIITDLTAHKRLQSQLLQSQKMEAVGRLAGGVAHDFNNVLTAITGFGQLALSTLPAEGEGAREDMEQVLAAADRAAALTRQLLAFSRQQVLQPHVLNMNAVVTSLSPMLARLIGEDVRLVARPAPKLSAVKADPSQLEQVLVNLVVNARDAMPSGGTLVIETANVELDATYARSHDGVTPGPHVMLAVTDTGTGMDVTTRARVFEPFFTTKEAGKGTGLGLATAYGIVRQSGGSIDVYSEPGQGSTFKVYLPRCEEVQEERRPVLASPVALPTGKPTVLLVDDDPHVAAAARRALERAGYKVLAANT